MKDWRDLQDQFSALVMRKGPKRVAADIPAALKTVYRLLRGAKKPTLAIRVRIEQLVKEEEKK